MSTSPPRSPSSNEDDNKVEDENLLSKGEEGEEESSSYEKKSENASGKEVDATLINVWLQQQPPQLQLAITAALVLII